jgi:hypothetical protein
MSVVVTSEAVYNTSSQHDLLHDALQLAQKTGSLETFQAPATNPESLKLPFAIRDLKGLIIKTGNLTQLNEAMSSLEEGTYE